MSEVLKKKLCVTMPDGSRYEVPVEAIARHRAADYAREFDGDIERSLTEDTVPLFEEDEYEINKSLQPTLRAPELSVRRGARL